MIERASNMLTLLILVVMSVTTMISIDKVKDKSMDVMYDIEDSVYSLHGVDKRGTGWVTKTKKGKKVIVTNAHVCGKNQVMTTKKNGVYYTLNVLAVDPSHDICLVQAPKNAEPLDLADDVYSDEKAYSVGFPTIDFMSSQFGYVKGYEPGFQIQYEDIDIKDCKGKKFKIISIEIESSKKKEPPKTEKMCMFTAEALVTTIQVDGGASGSPIVNSDKEVIGMTMVRAGNINWAKGVPLRKIKSFLNQH